MFLFTFFMHILGCVGTLVCVVPLDLNLFQQLLMLNTCPSGTCNRTRTRINLKIHVLHVQFILKHFFSILHLKCQDAQTAAGGLCACTEHLVHEVRLTEKK